ncbi:MAG: HIT domain-containing protein [Desulfobulbaceae bacterium]|nr:HIT domain-containing protein [Desulfobulbaceae bacterium]
MNVIKKCSFCAEFTSDKFYNLFYELVGANKSLQSRILFKNNDFVVIPTLGSLCPGYLLILPKKHFVSVGSMPNEYYQSLCKLLGNVKEIIQEKYFSNVIAFEHGAVSANYLGGACCDHAHIHVVPYNGNLLSSFQIRKFQIDEIFTFSSLSESVKNDKPYLFYQSQSNRMYMITADRIPSQMIRKIIAEKNGIPDKWDWRENLFEANIIKTISDFSDVFIDLHI